MPPSARRLQGITVAIAIAACGNKREEAPPPPPPRTAPAPAVDAEAGNHITISVTKPHAPGTGLAKRCQLAGPPLDSDCVGGSEGVAFDATGTLYLVAGDQVHRYRRAAGETCAFEPAGEPIALPAVPKRMQSLDGPVYMRSGGPAWHLASAGQAVYAVDYLAGLYRIDRGKPEAACTDVYGYESIAALGKRILIARNGIEQLVLGAHCKASSAHIDDKAHGGLFAIGDHLYAAHSSEITRYDGRDHTSVGKDGKICWAAAIVACGGGACVIDSNCMRVTQLADDGRVRDFDGDALFDVRPYSLRTAAHATDGTLFVLVLHRDATAKGEVCEEALYAIPPAAFDR